MAVYQTLVPNREAEEADIADLYDSIERAHTNTLLFPSYRAELIRRMVLLCYFQGVLNKGRLSIFQYVVYWFQMRKLKLTGRKVKDTEALDRVFYAIVKAEDRYEFIKLNILAYQIGTQTKENYADNFHA